VEGPSPRLQHPLQPMGPSAAEETQNRGNEAKKSLKTNEVSQTICAKRTHSCARKAPNEANIDAHNGPAQASPHNRSPHRATLSARQTLPGWHRTRLYASATGASGAVAKRGGRMYILVRQ
jgi:hypothetical protein